MHRETERERLIARIEGYTGTLESVPWELVSTQDLRKLLEALSYKE